MLKGYLHFFFWKLFKSLSYFSIGPPLFLKGLHKLGLLALNVWNKLQICYPSLSLVFYFGIFCMQRLLFFSIVKYISYCIWIFKSHVIWKLTLLASILHPSQYPHPLSCEFTIPSTCVKIIFLVQGEWKTCGTELP